MKCHASRAYRARYRPGFVGFAEEKVALHVPGLAMNQDTVAMAVVDKVHASVKLIHILKRHPAGDPAIEKISPPVGFILVPIGRGTIAWGLSEELVVPELHFGTYQAEPNDPIHARNSVFAMSGQTQSGCSARS